MINVYLMMLLEHSIEFFGCIKPQMVESMLQLKLLRKWSHRYVICWQIMEERQSLRRFPLNKVWAFLLQFTMHFSAAISVIITKPQVRFLLTLTVIYRASLPLVLLVSKQSFYRCNNDVLPNGHTKFCCQWFFGLKLWSHKLVVITERNVVICIIVRIIRIIHGFLVYSTDKCLFLSTLNLEVERATKRTWFPTCKLPISNH